MNPGSRGVQASSGSAQSLLRPSFIETANALAELYKRAVSAEREANHAGERAAYMAVLEWAARRSRNGEHVSASEVMRYASEQLARIPTAHQGGNGPQNCSQTEAHGPQGAVNAHGETGSGLNTAASADSGRNDMHSNPVACGGALQAVGDALVNRLNKLNVNPRKRPRIDLDDSLLSVFREEDIAHMPTDASTHTSDDNEREAPFSSSHPPRLISSSHSHHGQNGLSARKTSGRRPSRDGRPSRRKDEDAFN